MDFWEKKERKRQFWQGKINFASKEPLYLASLINCKENQKRKQQT